MEATSDINLFTISKEFGTLFKEDFYPFAMAAFFGYEVEQFQSREQSIGHESDFESEEEK